MSAVKHRRLTAIGRDFGNYYYFDGKAGEGNVTMGGSGAKPGLEVTPPFRRKPKRWRCNRLAAGLTRLPLLEALVHLAPRRRAPDVDGGDDLARPDCLDECRKLGVRAVLRIGHALDDDAAVAQRRLREIERSRARTPRLGVRPAATASVIDERKERE